MKHLKCTQFHPQAGNIIIDIRILGKELFMRFSENNPHKEQLVSQLIARGADVSETDNWIRINMFTEQATKGNPLIKMGEIEFNIQETSNEQVEEILFNFYTIQYQKAKFKVTEVING